MGDSLAFPLPPAPLLFPGRGARATVRLPPIPPEPSAAVDDVELLARVATGDEAAFADLFDRHSGTVLGLAHRMLGPGGEAEEALQEVFLQVWRQAGRYRPVLATPRGWLLMLARSRALDRLKSGGARARRERVVESARPEATQPVGSARLEHCERRRRLRSALYRLPAEQRQAVELAFFAGLTHSQIAERLGAPLGTVKSRILLGMRRLRTALAGLEPTASS